MSVHKKNVPWPSSATSDCPIVLDGLGCVVHYLQVQDDNQVYWPGRSSSLPRLVLNFRTTEFSDSNRDGIILQFLLSKTRFLILSGNRPWMSKIAHSQSKVETPGSSRMDFLCVVEFSSESGRLDTHL